MLNGDSFGKTIWVSWLATILLSYFYGNKIVKVIISIFCCFLMESLMDSLGSISMSIVKKRRVVVVLVLFKIISQCGLVGEWLIMIRPYSFVLLGLFILLVQVVSFLEWICLFIKRKKPQQVAWVQPKKLEIDVGYWLIVTSEYPFIFPSKLSNNQANNQLINYKQQVSCRNFLPVDGRTILLIVT